MTMTLIPIWHQGQSSEIDEALLVKTEGVVDNEHEHTTWVEYRFPGDDTIVHRSAHVTLKQLPDWLGSVLGQIGD